MNKSIKITLISILLLLLLSQILVISTKIQFPKEEIGKDTDRTETDEGIEEEENKPQRETLSPVLCEIGTATWCKYCPAISEKVYQICDSKTYPLYVISLVYDKSNPAKKRLEEDFNIYGFPTLFLDGGIKVIFGSDASKAQIENEIRKLAEEPKKNISIEMEANLEDNESISLRVHARNNEDSDYSGRLKVYLLEINSRWYDYDGKPYRFGLIDFIFDREIQLEAREEKTVTSNWRASKDLKPLNKDNLMIIAVLFSDEGHDRYSDPPGNKRRFKAYFVDALSAKRIGEGDLPPQIGIAIPKEGMLHFRSRPLIRTFFGRTILIGKTTMNFTVRDNGSFVKIKIYVDGTLRKIIADDNFDGEEEYHFKLPPLLGMHNIKIEAYDENAKRIEIRINTFCIILR